MKTIFFTTVLGILLMSDLGHAQSQRGPQLTDDQRTCLEGKIGSAGSDSRPSRDQMKDALESCGIEVPRRGARSGRSAQNLTDEQRSCLEGKVGIPANGSRPSREQMDSAFTDCGISRPGFGANSDLPTLKNSFARARTDEEKNAIRDSIRHIFHTTNDETVKAQVREFLRENAQPLTWSEPMVEPRSSAGTK